MNDARAGKACATRARQRKEDQRRVETKRGSVNYRSVPEVWN